MSQDEPTEHRQSYLTDEQRNILIKAFSSEFLGKNSYLSGGTALAVFYAGHRSSKDLDFFFKNDIDLSRYVRLFKSFGVVDLTVAESPHFCSYIYRGDIKADFVYDALSGNTNDKPVLTIGQTNISVDNIENIAINKLCTVVTRTDYKDIADVWWLFSRRYAPEHDFPGLYIEAQKREGALDDVAFAKSVFEYISENAKTIVSGLADSGLMLTEMPPDELSSVFTELSRLINSIFHNISLNKSLRNKPR